MQAVTFIDQSRYPSTFVGTMPSYMSSNMPAARQAESVSSLEHLSLGSPTSSPTEPSIAEKKRKLN